MLANVIFSLNLYVFVDKFQYLVQKTKVKL